MLLKKLFSMTKSLEDKNNPLLGPTLKGLYTFGLWTIGTKLRTVTYNTLHFTTFLFIITQFIYLYTVRHDINKVLENMSVAGLSTVCLSKCCSYILRQKDWRELVNLISQEELQQIKQQDSISIKHMKKYTKYSRIVTYLYWLLVLGTTVLMIVTPLLKYVFSETYRDDVKAGTEPLPQIMCTWFPFDNTRMPGYVIALFVHIVMSVQGSGVLGAFDMNAIAIQCYLKGQMAILKERCERMFDEVTSMQDVLDRIRECHRHHSVLVKQHQLYNSLLSPTMFQYVLMCSITICSSVVQISSTEITTSQKLWIVEFTLGLILQLFLYCWHSNEVTLQSREVDRGVYESEWWRGDVRVRKQLLLLSGKFTYPFVLEAGPYSTLSVPTFIDIMKGSYSFFTLFSQLKHE